MNEKRAHAGGEPWAGLRGELVRVVHELFAATCVTAIGGNLSARLPDEAGVLITPTGLFKGDLQPDLLAWVGLDGRVLDPSAPAPSSEWPMHCAIYRARPDVGAIVHAHAPRATVLALSGLPLLPVSAPAACLGELPRVPFVTPGTEALAEAVVEALGEGPAVLMQNHGLLAVGDGLRQAANRVHVIERTADVILSCYAVGREPAVLSEEEIAALRKAGTMTI